jgi:hypothetical protein
VAHEFVVSIKLIAFNANDGAIICNTNKKITTIRVQKRGHGLQHSVRYELVVLAVFLEIPPQRGFELESLGFATFDKLCRVAVATEILIEQKVLIASPNPRSSVMRL